MTKTERGKLKIFFSYAQSIGKTQAMLEAARAAQARGTDVVVGFLAAHAGGPAPTGGLEMLPPRAAEPEPVFDLDAALARRPELILVDELAHANGKGSRHSKRYQEIEELLQAGIDVYTTVNVGNIESLQDTVESITGITTWERIPDAVFDRADQVELIDIEPQELLARRRQEDTACRITLPQLTALREIALRRCADRVKRLAEETRQRSFCTDEHVLVCLSSAPSNARIIRTAARMAQAFHGQFTALFVETPDFAVASPENRARLRENQRLAGQLGADIETVYGEEVPYQIAEYARLSGVTRIVLGRSAAARKWLFGRTALTEQLLAYAPEMDIHIIPDQRTETAYRPKRVPTQRGALVVCNIAKSVGILLGATLLSLLFHRLGFTDANIIMVYILGVLLTSIATSHRLYSLASSIASVFIFNYLFTVPRFSLAAYETGYPVTFVVMFLTAYITGTFAIRCKEQAGQSAKIAHRNKILFDTDRLLSKAGSKDEILNAAAEQIQKLLNRDLVVYDCAGDQLGEPRWFRQGGQQGAPFDLQKETATARWALQNGHAAGATTDTMSDARCLYLALRVHDRVYGVIGIEAGPAPLEASEYSILLSILGECALALENEKNAREKEAAAVLAESEQLRANLLRTISHDLRTPLTAISGHASNLLHSGDTFDEATKRQIYSDIYEDSLWLIDLVENLLYATRIEEGRMTLRTAPELLNEIVEEAVRHTAPKTNGRSLSVDCGDELLLVRADARLVVQVIANIVDNALKYTPPSAEIAVTAGRRNGLAEVCVADTGAGVPDEEKTKVFDKFYCGAHKIADNRRSLGLGLYLCKAIVEAHGGTIRVEDNHPRGAVFRFTLPLEEVALYE